MAHPKQPSMREAIKKALADQIHVVEGHLQLEGVAYVKITATGPMKCFSADVTSQIVDDSMWSEGKPTYTKWKR